MGHMRTNKNCPKYGEEPETTEVESAPSKSHPSEAATQLLPKTPSKKLPKMEASEGAERPAIKAPVKILPLKFKYGPPETQLEMISPGPQSSERQATSSAGMAAQPTKKIKKIIISNKTKPQDTQQEAQRPAVVIRIPAEADRDQPRKKIIFKQTKGGASNQEAIGLTPEIGVDDGCRKIKKITELASSEAPGKQPTQWLPDETRKGKATGGRKSSKEEEKKRKERINEERNRRLMLEEERQMQEQQRLLEIRRYEDAEWEDKQKEIKKKEKKKKKPQPQLKDEYAEEFRASRGDRRIPERDRAAKRRAVADLGRDAAEYAPPTKRRRGGEVLLFSFFLQTPDPFDWFSFLVGQSAIG